ncbi:hypothetical protein PMIN04_007359 [Paraphaeosphaeria minitans]
MEQRHTYEISTEEITISTLAVADLKPPQDQVGVNTIPQIASEQTSREQRHRVCMRIFGSTFPSLRQHTASKPLARYQSPLHLITPHRPVRSGGCVYYRSVEYRQLTMRLIDQTPNLSTTEDQTFPTSTGEF